MTRNNNLKNLFMPALGNLPRIVFCLLLIYIMACHPATGDNFMKDIYMSNSTPGVTIDPAKLTLKKAEPEDAPLAEIVTVEEERLPLNIPRISKVVVAQDGKAYLVLNDTGNPYAVQLGSRQSNALIRETLRREGRTITSKALNDATETFRDFAETSGTKRDVYNRVAPLHDGVEIDLGIDSHERVRITSETVEVVSKGSQSIFYRPSIAEPMVMPAESGNLDLLKKYLNMHPVDQTLFIAWLTYTLATPKTPNNQFVILEVLAGYGCGKSFLSKSIIQPLVDPNRAGLQMMPRADKDFAIMTKNSHVICLENVRNITQAMSDMFCVTSTGGSISSRQLYTDADQAVLHTHAAIVISGIHPAIDQPDMAQRTLTINLKKLDEGGRKSEDALRDELKNDLPAIQMGLFKLISDIFKQLPDVEVSSPERMIKFSRWLAAMERVHNTPSGVYQQAYSESLREGQRSSLCENLLAATVLEFAESRIVDAWSGTPAELLGELNSTASKGSLRSREWPQNPIALSKRLAPLQMGLLSQGIQVDFRRGKNRIIQITALDSEGGK